MNFCCLDGQCLYDNGNRGFARNTHRIRLLPFDSVSKRLTDKNRYILVNILRDNGQEMYIFSLDLSYRDDTYFDLCKITYFSNGY